MQAWRDSNPQPSVLETDALPIEPQACIKLFRLFMKRMVAAIGAIFFEFNPGRMFTLILGRIIVPVFANAAF